MIGNPKILCVCLVALASACSRDSSGLRPAVPPHTEDPEAAVRALRGHDAGTDSAVAEEEGGDPLGHPLDSGSVRDAAEDAGADVAAPDAALADAGQLDLPDASSVTPDASNPAGPCTGLLVSVCSTSQCAAICEWSSADDSGFSCCENPAHLTDVLAPVCACPPG